MPMVFRDGRHTVPAQRRRHRILALLQDDPTRLWRPAEIAAHFGDVTLHAVYRQLSRWADSGLIHKIGPCLYAATTWTSTALQLRCTWDDGRIRVFGTMRDTTPSDGATLFSVRIGLYSRQWVVCASDTPIDTDYQNGGPVGLMSWAVSADRC
ncbi:helix-turn-helix domain-containing protein [Streptomyces sp. NPDC087437]|uniref:helix-turn-helix domain-containing protein n=1 Tax=Streptomyces sp. NPDC087437 TaxID=3365789 RepID=UPI0038112BD5